jgi:ubiquitin carboxyl-terminal hydrolase 4/11/15
LPESEHSDDEVAAKEAWNSHLYRNESIITDLFHGLYKSTVTCSKCSRVSVTFDPMMTMLLPIPEKSQHLSFFFVPYQITDKYINKSGSVVIRPNRRIMDLR